MDDATPRMPARRVSVVPCSGIGKTFGTVSREAANALVEDLRPETTRIVPLSLLVLGDPEARATVEAGVTVTIDGCKLACASKMVRESGGRVLVECNVLDAFRRHRDLKPQGIARLNDAGAQLASAIADELAAVVDTAGKEHPDA